MAEINAHLRNTCLRKARLNRFWTAKIAAEQVGVSIVTYQRWELGIQVPHPSSLRMLCKAFAANSEELGFGEMTDVEDKIQLNK